MRACICIYASGVLYLQAAPRSYACMQHHGPILACSTTVLYLHAAPQYCLRVVVHTHPCMHAHMDYAITWFLVPAHTHTQRAHICARALTTSQQCGPCPCLPSAGSASVRGPWRAHGTRLLRSAPPPGSAHQHAGARGQAETSRAAEFLHGVAAMFRVCAHPMRVPRLHARMS